MLRTDLAIAVRSDREQRRGLAARLREQLLEQIAAACVRPLQIVEKEHERPRVARGREQEAPDREGEPLLRLQGLELRYGRELAEQLGELGSELGHDRRERSQCLGERAAPAS